jgi:2-methylcitrate dehydratase PrpD
MNETRTLAQFITDINFDDLSSEVVEKAKLLFLDQLGCQLAFAALPWNKAIYNYIKEKKGYREESTVIRYGLRTTAEDTAFANAVFGHGFEMDDTELSSASHPGVTVIPPALAAGEMEKITGKEFITAVVAGYDVFIRVGLATRSMISRGFHTTAVLGPLGAAAATSKVLKLDVDRTLNALSIAASESGGLAEYTESGGSVKRVHAGFAAQSGLKATLLAKAGITGPTTALEGRKGFCQAFANEYSLEEMTAGLGKEFRILLTGNKPYCCCAAQHSALDAVSAIMRERVIVPEEIMKIEVSQKARDVRATGNIVEPRDIVAAQFSGHFGIALRLIKGSNGLQDYSKANLSNPQVLSLAHLIEYHIDDEMEKSNPAGAPARVEIHLKNGSIHERTVQYAKGTIQNPMTGRELEDKFRELTATLLTREHAEKIVRIVSKLEELDNLRNLISLLILDQRSLSHGEFKDRTIDPRRGELPVMEIK